MMLTEDEAITKWCPFTRVGEQASGAAENRPDGNYNCIASRCMAWRQQTYFKNSKTGEYPMLEGAYETGTAAECGYCGLAGHPFPAFIVPDATTGNQGGTPR